MDYGGQTLSSAMPHSLILSPCVNNIRRADACLSESNLEGSRPRLPSSIRLFVPNSLTTFA